MTLIRVEEFRADLDRYLAAATQGDVVLSATASRLRSCVRSRTMATRMGAFAGSADFWRMIHERRQEQGIPWEEARQHLDLGGT